MKRLTGDDSGLTLIETLIAVTILGLAFAALMGALGTAVTLSEVHRSRALAEDSLRNFAESVKHDGYRYSPTGCPTWSPPAFDPRVSGSVSEVVLWNGDSPATFTGCGGPDRGLERLTLTVTATVSGFETVQSTQILLRKP